MTVTLNRRSYEYAQKLIKNRQCVLDDRERWTDHKPARTAEKRFIKEHGLAEFAWWHLGEDDEEAPGSRRRYKFPYGDFERLHRCAVLAAESRAGRNKCTDIQLAAAKLNSLLDELMSLQATKAKEWGRAPSP